MYFYIKDTVHLQIVVFSSPSSLCFLEYIRWDGFLKILRDMHHMNTKEPEPTKNSYSTPRKINMEPDKTPLEDENNLPNHNFQVLC